MTGERFDDVAAAVAAKVHRRVLPLLAAGWFIAYLDRFNVGFAALQMNADLGLSAAVFGFGAGIFFIGYSLFEIPSNVILARVGPRVWLARIMITWGLISAAMIFAQGPWSFYLLRFLLGVAEAGCFPGMAYYLARWLSPRDRAAALATLATMSMVSGVAGGPLAAALLWLDEVAGLAGWQWLFLIEGLPAILIGWGVFRLLPDGPDAVPWLTPAERAWVRAQAGLEQQHLPSRTALASVLRDGRYWTWAMAFFCVAAAGSALRLFQPTILRAMTGLGDGLTAVLTAVPSLVGVVAILYVGRRSTRHDERRWHAAVPIFVAAAGLAVMGLTYGVVPALLVASVATIGVAAQPPIFASVSAAATGAVNAVGIAFVNSVASVGAFLGPYLLGYALDRTGSLALVCAGAGAVMAAGGALAAVKTERAQPVATLAEQVSTT